MTDFLKYSTSQLICDTVFSYVFWSFIHGSIVIVWRQALMKQYTTPYVFSVFVAFLPILLILNKLCFNIIRKWQISSILVFSMIGGFTSLYFSPSSRLLVIFVGIVSSFLIQCILLWCEDISKRKTSFWGFTLGYIALLSSRIWYSSFIPLWNDSASNKAIVILFLIALVWRRFSVEHDLKSSSSQKYTSTTNQVQIKRKKHFLLPSFAYGSILFILHTLFGEVSILARFSSLEVQDNGPNPNPWGGLVLLMLTLGVFISMHSNVVETYAWSVLGGASYLGFMFCQGWPGFICGAFLGAYVTSVWPKIVGVMVHCENPIMSVATAFSVYAFGLFEVAGGWMFSLLPIRILAIERSTLIAGIMMACIVWSVMREKNSTNSFSIKLQLPELKYYTKSQRSTLKTPPEEERLGTTVKKCLFVFVMAGLIGFEYRKSMTQNYVISTSTEAAYTMTMNTNFSIIINSYILLHHANAGNYLCLENLNIADSKQFSSVLWNTNFGYDTHGWSNMERAANVLNKTQADVIVLLQSDTSKPHLGNNDLVSWLSEQLGMYSDFGSATKYHVSGSALLSKHPIVTSRHQAHWFPDDKVMFTLSASINISGSLVNFVTTHVTNGNLHGKLVAETLANVVAQAKSPVVFLGAINLVFNNEYFSNLLVTSGLENVDSNAREGLGECILYTGLTKIHIHEQLFLFEAVDYILSKAEHENANCYKLLECLCPRYSEDRSQFFKAKNI